MAQIVKLRIAPKGCKQILPSLKFQKLVELTCKSLTVPLYPFLSEMQKVKVVQAVITLMFLRIQKREVLLLFQIQEQQESVSHNSKGIINKIKQENKCIPDLIFQIEDCERYLIQLSKVTKLNLLRHAKRSTARDFKIIEDSDPPAGGEDGGNQEEETETQNNNIGEDDLRQESDDDGSEEMLSPRNASSVSSPGLDSDKTIAAATEEDDEEEQEQDEGEEESGDNRPKKMARKSWVVEDSDEDSETF